MDYIRVQTVRAQALDPDNASILVAGGGGVALSVTRRLKDMGSWVWVLQRSDTRRSALTGMDLFCTLHNTLWVHSDL